jgi:hypothetical protein
MQQLIIYHCQQSRAIDELLLLPPDFVLYDLAGFAKSSVFECGLFNCIIVLPDVVPDGHAVWMLASEAINAFPVARAAAGAALILPV